MSGRLGLLGGTFDPPHLGHLVVAEHARVQLRLDEVRLLVAGQPWMKARITAAAHRVAMAELAAHQEEHLRVDARETGRDGPTYTADTLEQLAAEEPGCRWFFLAGADAIAKLPRWHRAEDALALATFAVADRPGHRARLDGPLLSRVQRLAVPLIGVSSTDLRRRFAAGEPVRYLTPASVIRYVEERRLYGPAS